MRKTISCKSCCKQQTFTKRGSAWVCESCQAAEEAFPPQRCAACGLKAAAYTKLFDSDWLCHSCSNSHLATSACVNRRYLNDLCTLLGVADFAATPDAVRDLKERNAFLENRAMTRGQYLDEICDIVEKNLHHDAPAAVRELKSERDRLRNRESKSIRWLTAVKLESMLGVDCEDLPDAVAKLQATVDKAPSYQDLLRRLHSTEAKLSAAEIKAARRLHRLEEIADALGGPEMLNSSMTAEIRDLKVDRRKAVRLQDRLYCICAELGVPMTEFAGILPAIKELQSVYYDADLARSIADENFKLRRIVNARRRCPKCYEDNLMQDLMFDGGTLTATNRFRCTECGYEEAK